MTDTYVSRAAHVAYAHHSAKSGRLRPVEIAALALIALALVVAATGVTRSAGALELTPVKVGSGETLWQIARTHPVEGLTTAETVDLIAEKNRLSDGGVQAGATLMVPSAPGDDTLAMR